MIIRPVARSLTSRPIDKTVVPTDYFKTSPFHFSRVFKQTTGITPLPFVTRERMLQAQQLIRETSLRLIEIALEVELHESKPFRSGISADGGYGSYAIP